MSLLTPPAPDPPGGAGGLSRGAHWAPRGAGAGGGLSLHLSLDKGWEGGERREASSGGAGGTEAQVERGGGAIAVRRSWVEG